MSKSSVGIYYHSVILGIKTRGFIQTFYMVIISLLDIAEDRIKGIIAHEFVDSKNVTKLNSSKFANFYQPVRSIPFRKLFREMKFTADGNFVDIGAGTGKALILAKEQGFEKVKGIELVPYLVELAQENKKKFNFSDIEFECICEDALNYKFEKEDQFFFLNDPFSDEVYQPFMSHLVDHFLNTNKKIVVVYKNNSLRKMSFYDNIPNYCKYKEVNYWGNLYQIVWFDNSLK